MTPLKLLFAAAYFLAFSLATTSQANTVHMQIVAHEDDDFLFMNPDLQNDISAGLNIVTVYITAGEANGAGACTDAGNFEAGRDEHAHARQKAVRAAYAQMANPALSASQADNALWSRDLLVPDAGVTWPHTVERYTLATSPNIQLIFMDLREDGEDPRGGETIGHMLADPSLVTNTIVPSCGTYGSCVHTPSCNPDMPWQNYTRSQLITVLTDLVSLYQPQLVRTLDPNPFEKLGNSITCPGYDVCYDNLDHRAAARYADLVISKYLSRNAGAQTTVLHYKGYSFTNYPRDVGTESYNAKRQAGEAYRQSTPGDPYYLDSSYDPYYRAIYERYPAGTQWLQKAADGRLVAVGVLNRQVVLWYENAVGGNWTGPVGLNSGGPIAPQVALIKRNDGRLQIFAMRLPLSMERDSPAPVTQNVIAATQIGTSMAFSSWRNLGAPDVGQFNSIPAAVADGSGHVFVFARNSSGMLGYTGFNAGSWSTWSEVEPGALDIMDGVGTVTRADGTVDVFVTDRSGKIHHYVQSGLSFIPDPTLGIKGAASAPAAALNQDGRIQIFYREATDGTSLRYGRVRTVSQQVGGQWSTSTSLFGDAGTGPVAATRREGSGHIMIFERNTWGGLSTTMQKQPNGNFYLQWNLRGGLIEEYLAAATDNLGREVVAAKGADNRLYIQRETSASQPGSFGDWQVEGN